MKFPLPNPPSGGNPASLALDAVLVVSEGSGRPDSDEDAALLALVDGRRTVAEILRISRLAGSVALRRLRALSDRRMVRPVATRLPGAAARIPNPRMGATQDLRAAAEAFASAAVTSKSNDRTAPSSQSAPRAPVVAQRAWSPARATAPSTRPTSPTPARVSSPTPRRVPMPPSARARVTPSMGAPSAPVSTVVVADPDIADFHALHATPPPEPTRAPPRPSPSGATSALIPAGRGTGRTEVIARQPPRPSTDYVSAGPASPMHDLWSKLSHRDWATLALVPAHASGSALSVACALTEVGAAYLGRPISLLSAEGRELEPKENWIFPRNKDERHARVIALEPLTSNPRGIAVAQAADAVVLVVEAGQTDVASAKRAIEKIGRQRFLGCVMLPAR